MSRPETFHLRWRGRVTGPFSWQEVERKLDAHEIGLLHDLQSNNEWLTLGEYLEVRGEIVRINAAVAALPTAADFKTPPSPPPLASVIPKITWTPKRWIFVTLGILAGFLGLHDFYAHHWIRGAILLVAAVILYRLEWGIVWPWLWAIGEIIATKLDGKGRRMSWKRQPK